MVLARYNNEWKTVAGGTCYADTPVGTIQAYGGTQLPAGWLLCNGAELLISAYPELYDVIGDAFGTASDTNHFVLPDLRESVPKGAGLTGKSNNHLDVDGLALGEFIDDRLQGHWHQIPNQAYETNRAGGDNRTQAANPTYTGNWYAKTISSDTTNGTPRIGATTEVKAVGVNYIIKAKKVALPADFNAHVKETVVDTFPKYQAGEYIEPFGDIGDSNYISYTSEFTAPSAGYLIGDLGRNYTYSRTSDPKLLVNGISLIAIYSTNALFSVPLYIPLRKGDKITFSMDSGDRLNRGRLKFFPM